MFSSAHQVTGGWFDAGDLAESPFGWQSLDYEDYGDLDYEDYGDLDYEEDFGDEVDLVEAFRSALSEDYADTAPEEVEEAMLNVFDSLAPAESFNLGQALQHMAQDPALARIAATALPAAGAIYGGPGGAAIGAAAAKALSKPGRPSPPAQPAAMSPERPPSTALRASPTTPMSTRPPNAALSSLVMMTKPEVLQSALAVALGEYGRSTVGRDQLPVGTVLHALSSMLQQAAADADEMLQSNDRPPSYLMDAEGNLRADLAVPAERALALYKALIDAEDQQLADTPS